MPRPRKCRKVCCLPQQDIFCPQGQCYEEERAVILGVDQYEALRLIDYQGMTQEECGSYMKVARTTVQQIYDEARRKVSIALVEGRPLKISGGEYQLCKGEEAYCRCGGCKKHRALQISDEEGKEKKNEDCSNL